LSALMLQGDHHLAAVETQLFAHAQIYEGTPFVVHGQVLYPFITTLISAYVQLPSSANSPSIVQRPRLAGR
jgi:hypothetical protein